MPASPPCTLSISELTVALIAENKNVLIPDTCTILDIIRSPIRAGGEIVMREAISMAQCVVAGTLSFAIVLPSVLLTEWQDNLGNVRAELNHGLTEHKRLSDSLMQLHRYHTGAEFLIPDVMEKGFDDILEQTCKTIMDGAYTVQKEDHIVMRAFERVLQKRPPSRKGKPEIKDCSIFEEVLALGKAMASQSFKKSIIFCSTNKEEYNPSGKVLPEIAIDLAEAGVQFAAHLQHASHLASK